MFLLLFLSNYQRDAFWVGLLGSFSLFGFNWFPKTCLDGAMWLLRWEGFSPGHQVQSSFRQFYTSTQ